MNSRILILTTIMLLFYACREKHPEQPVQLKDIVDKEVQRTLDSIEQNSAAIQNHPGQTINHLKTLAQYFSYTSDSATHASLMLKLSSMHSMLGHSDSALLCGKEALIYFEKHAAFVKQLVLCYNTVGLSLDNLQQNIFEANYYMTKAASICLAKNSDSIMPIRKRIQTLYLAATTNYLCEQNEQALHYAKAAYQLVYPGRDSLCGHYVRTCCELANVYHRLKKYDSVRIYTDIARSWNNNHCYNSLHEADIESILINYYWGIKKYDSSLAHLINTRLNAYDDLPAYVFSKACYKTGAYSYLQQPLAAKENLLAAEKLLAGRADDPNLTDYYRNRAVYYILYGKRKEAVHAFEAFDSVIQYFYREDRLKILSSIESEYNLADKQKKLDQLDKANQSAREDIRQKNNFLIITILGILLCTVVIIVLLLLSRQRRLHAITQAAEAQRDKIELEQRLLRAQMEPHFIFNTLAAMQGLIYNNENNKAITYLNRFAKLLRTSLEHSREHYIPVSEEIEALENYISLQAMQAGNSFDYSIHPYAGYEDDEVRIPPMLLQPFVENAILHGVMHLPHRGRVAISIEKEEKTLHCIIADNGTGIRAAPDSKRKSLAISIARERLETLSKETGTAASLSIVARPPADGGGTIVHVIIPFIS